MSDNALLFVTVFRSGSTSVSYKTVDFLDINHARRELAKTITNSNSSLIVADEDEAGFHMIPVRNITGIKVREADPEAERVRAEERQRAELRKQGELRGTRHLTAE